MIALLMTLFWFSTTFTVSHSNEQCSLFHGQCEECVNYNNRNSNDFSGEFQCVFQISTKRCVDEYNVQRMAALTNNGMIDDWIVYEDASQCASLANAIHLMDNAQLSTIEMCEAYEIWSIALENRYGIVNSTQSTRRALDAVISNHSMGLLYDCVHLHESIGKPVCQSELLIPSIFIDSRQSKITCSTNRNSATLSTLGADLGEWIIAFTIIHRFVPTLNANEAFSTLLDQMGKYRQLYACCRNVGNTHHLHRCGDIFIDMLLTLSQPNRGVQSHIVNQAFQAFVDVAIHQTHARSGHVNLFDDYKDAYDGDDDENSSVQSLISVFGPNWPPKLDASAPCAYVAPVIRHTPGILFHYAQVAFERRAWMIQVLRDNYVPNMNVETLLNQATLLSNYYNHQFHKVHLPHAESFAVYMIGNTHK